MDSRFLYFDLFQVQLFLVASECRSFTKTSQIMNTSQSTVSKSISSLEKALGFPLFLREKGKLSLTSQGELLAHDWSDLILKVEQSIDRAASLDESQELGVIVGEPDSMKTDKDYLPAIEQYRKGHQNVSLSFVERPIGELVDHLMMDDLDVVFTIDYELPTIRRLGLSWAPVSDSPYIQVTMHSDNPLARRESITFDDLRDEEFIVPNPVANQSYVDLLESLCHEHGFAPRIGKTVPNFRSVVSTILRTHHGVLLANRFIYDANSAQLKSFSMKDTYSRLIVVWKPDSKRPQIEELCRCIAKGYKPAISKA
ncbi:MAG: LysR substrate-binding domain-containing protein [Tractidigestivibacter sp.]|uniref:LysR family transcriptional regulator n=1 Tax=Tractidigestivibacter sp. TaxID=2847320 RepID=UPI003D8A24F4